jgi:hypothetical protein
MVVMSLPAIGELAAPRLAVPALSARPADLSLQSLPTRATDLLQRAFNELRTLGFPFLIEQGSVYQHPDRSNLYGLAFQDTLLAPRRQGADIVFTLDTDAAERSVLSYIIGRSEADGLHLATILLTAEGKRYESGMVVARTNIASTHAPARSHLRQALTDHSWATAAEGGQAGPVLREHTAWYYDHCASPIWAMGDGSGQQRGIQLRLTHCQEFRDTRPVTAGQARFDGWQSEVHTIVLASSPGGRSSRTTDSQADLGPKES